MWDPNGLDGVSVARRDDVTLERTLHLFGFFLKWGAPASASKKMHKTFFYFIYSTKIVEKPYNNHTN
jgi:hypothetical protein